MVKQTELVHFSITADLVRIASAGLCLQQLLVSSDRRRANQLPAGRNSICSVCRLLAFFAPLRLQQRYSVMTAVAIALSAQRLN